MAADKPYYVYVLAAMHTARYTYVGVTVDLERRLRQHNGEIVGGARATTALSKRVVGHAAWHRVLHITGAPNATAALQAEWRLKRLSVAPARAKRAEHANAVAAAGLPLRMYSVAKRLAGLLALLRLPTPTAAAAAFTTWNNGAGPTVVLEDATVATAWRAMIADAARRGVPLPAYVHTIDAPSTPFSHTPVRKGLPGARAVGTTSAPSAPTAAAAPTPTPTIVAVAEATNAVAPVMSSTVTPGLPRLVGGEAAAAEVHMPAEPAPAPAPAPLPTVLLVSVSVGAHMAVAHARAIVDAIEVLRGAGVHARGAFLEVPDAAAGANAATALALAAPDVDAVLIADGSVAWPREAPLQLVCALGLLPQQHPQQQQRHVVGLAVPLPGGYAWDDFHGVAAAALRRSASPHNSGCGFIDVLRQGLLRYDIARDGACSVDIVDGMMEVARVGGGLIAVRRSALTTLTAALPSLHCTPPPGVALNAAATNAHVALFQSGVANGAVVDAAAAFCNRWRALGGKVYVHALLGAVRVVAAALEGRFLSTVDVGDASAPAPAPAPAAPSEVTPKAVKDAPTGAPASAPEPGPVAAPVPAPATVSSTEVVVSTPAGPKARAKRAPAKRK